MERFRERMELARIERIRDIILHPPDRRRPSVSGAESLVARLLQRGAEIEGRPEATMLR